MTPRRGLALLLLAALIAASSYTVHMIFNITPRPFTGFFINSTILTNSSIVLHTNEVAVAYCLGNLTILGLAEVYVPSATGTVMNVTVIGNVDVLHGCFRINSTLVCMNLKPSSIELRHDTLLMIVPMPMTKIDCSNCTISISIVNSTFTPPVFVKARGEVEIVCSG